MATTSENLARLSEEDTTQLIASINREIEKSRMVLDPWKKKVVAYYELYTLYQNRKNYEGVAKIFVPEILRAVETITGNIYKAITGENPWFEYLGRTPTDEPGARAQNELVRYQMDENNFNVKLMDSIRQMVLTGLTIRKVLWDYEEVKQITKRVKIENKQDGILKQPIPKRKVITSEGTETTKDVWTFESVDLLSFHISDICTSYTDIQKARWIAEEYQVDYQWIKERVKLGWLDGRHLEDLKMSKETRQGSPTMYLKDRREAAAGFYNTQSLDNTPYEIVERWGLVEAHLVYSPDERKTMQLDDDDMVQAVTIVANHRIILKLEPTPFWHNRMPYLACPYIPKENELPGIGVAQIAQPMQEELNDTRNQIMDHKTFSIMNMWLKTRSSGIQNKDLRIRPQGVIHTNDINGLKALQPPPLIPMAIGVENLSKEDIRQSTGAMSNLQGIAQPGVGSATESALINRESMGRLAMVAELYGRLILKPLLAMVESLNYQYYNTDKVIKIIGPDGIKFVRRAPDDIAGEKDIIIKLASDFQDAPSVRRQQLMQFFTLLMQTPPPVITTYWKLVDQIYKGFFPNGSLEDVIPAPPQDEVLIEPLDENRLMMNGQPVEVKQGDNDEEHIQTHMADLKATHLALPDNIKKAFMKHIQEHEQQLQQKHMQQNMQQLMQMKSLMGGGQGQGGGEAGGVPGGQNVPNLGQIPNTNAFTASADATPGQVIHDARMGQ